MTIQDQQAVDNRLRELEAKPKSQWRREDYDFHDVYTYPWLPVTVPDFILEEKKNWEWNYWRDEKHFELIESHMFIRIPGHFTHEHNVIVYCKKACQSMIILRGAAPYRKRPWKKGQQWYYYEWLGR